jgi:hypothetical protein
MVFSVGAGGGLAGGSDFARRRFGCVEIRLSDGL